MSKFFRSADSSSSDSDSEAISGSEDDPEEINISPSLDNELSLGRTDNDDGVVGHPSSSWNSQPRDLLLHALLEERCLNEVLASRNLDRFGRAPKRDSPEVKAEAHSRYLRLCSRLHSYNLISKGPEQDSHTHIRQRYRDGLDLLGQQSSASTVPYPLRRLLMNTDAEVTQHSRSITSPRGHSLGSQVVPDPLQSLLMASGSIPPMPFALMSTIDDTSSQHGTFNDGFESRYRREFEELSTLGRGGYGIVYRVRHRIDNQPYAVKKVPLSAARLQRLQTRGQQELDELLLEVRTLARLEHPNIVRYHGCWIEWVHDTPQPAIVSSDFESQIHPHSKDATRGGEYSRSVAVGSIVTQNSDEEAGIMFEDSGATSRHGEQANWSSDDISRSRMIRLQKVGTRDTVATVSEEAIETISRQTDQSASILSGDGRPHFTQPTLALHMQMSLHPMTLADFLSPPSDAQSDPTGSAPRLSHCFHLEPSVSILLAIIDGVEYLHSEGIVHRDIKPANIFLGPNNELRSTRGSADLLLCKDCRAAGSPHPASLHVRIGDFGLVTALTQEAGVVVESPAVGTEIYRPSTALSNASPGLDIYALGIIAFELLWKFGTRMERHHTLQQLKQGEFPNGFSARLGKNSAAAMECIAMMLSCGASEGISVKELKETLSLLQT